MLEAINRTGFEAGTAQKNDSPDADAKTSFAAEPLNSAYHCCDKSGEDSPLLKYISAL